MKSPFPPPPAPDELRALRVHEAVRDYPELLPHLAPPGGVMGDLGANLLSEVISGVPGGETGILSLLSWRGGGGA
jgi:hypothetical protein